MGKISEVIANASTFWNQKRSSVGAVRNGTHEYRWKWQSWHLLLLSIGVLLRVGFSLTVDKESSFAGWDGKEYFAYAQSLVALNGDDYPRYFNYIRPPFYPILLSPFVALNSVVVWPIQWAQSFMGAFQAVILGGIAGRWQGQRAGNWAFVMAIFHPFLIYYCAFVITETLFITLLWSGIAALQRLTHPRLESTTRWLTGGGVALGLACLTRPALQPFLIIAAGWIGWRVLSVSNWLTALKKVAYFTAVVSTLLLPFMVHNYWAHHDLSLAPGGAQMMYALGSSREYLESYEARTKEEYYQIFFDLFRRYSVESGTSPDTWAAEARDFRKKSPGDWSRLQWYKFQHYWTPWLNPLIFSRRDFFLSFFSATPLFVLAFAEFARRRFRLDPFLLLLLGLVLVGYLVGGLLFQVQVRYRIPYVDVTFLILSASFLSRISARKLSELKWPLVLRPSKA